MLSRMAERYYEEEGRVAILEVSILTVIYYPLKDIFEGSSLMLMQMLRKNAKKARFLSSIMLFLLTINSFSADNLQSSDAFLMG